MGLVLMVWVGGRWGLASKGPRSDEIHFPFPWSHGCTFACGCSIFLAKLLDTGKRGCSLSHVLIAFRCF